MSYNSPLTDSQQLKQASARHPFTPEIKDSGWFQYADAAMRLFLFEGCSDNSVQSQERKVTCLSEDLPVLTGRWGVF